MKFFFSVFLCFSSLVCQAAIVDDAKITRLYVQSLNGPHKSGGHAASVDKSIDPSCGYRLYIDPLDKELFSTLLAYKISGTGFSFMYSTGEPSTTISGHVVTTCKLFSVY